jgi:hypothetical protein
MKGQVTLRLGGQYSAYFPILQGVAQGCPLSPIIFNIYVDSSSNELHRAGQLHGIPSADCQDKLGGQAYADDTDAMHVIHMSSSNEGLQHPKVILHVQRCLAEDLLLHLAMAVHKCQAMCFHPRGQDAAPDLYWPWESQAIVTTASVRFLGLHVEPELSWTVQIAKALRNGRNALRNVRHMLCKPHLSVDVKPLIVKTYIVSREAVCHGGVVPTHPEKETGRKRTGDGR